MKKLFTMSAFVGIVSLGMVGTTIATPIYNSSTDIPDANILINYNNSGLDWVYAGPIGTGEWGPGDIEAPSYRADEGWRFATQIEWENKPEWYDFIQPGYSTADVQAVASYSDHTKYKFASEYWGSFYHVDLNDAASGNITNGFDIGSLTNVYETWYVRDSQSNNVVPEPTTLLLFGAGLASLSFIGRARNK